MQIESVQRRFTKRLPGLVMILMIMQGLCSRPKGVMIYCLYITLFQKSYQFINVVNGVSHSHKTVNMFFVHLIRSFDIAC